MMPAELPATWAEKVVKPTAPTMAPIPAAFKPCTSGGTPYGLKAKRDELETLRTATKGSPGRNITANTVALKLGARHAGGEIEDCREEIYVACVANGLVADDGECSVRASIESGWSAGLKEPRPAPPKPGRPAPTPSNKPAPVVDITSAETWADPEPLPDGLPPVPQFVAELLPESLRAWVVDIAERLHPTLTGDSSQQRILCK